MGKKRAYKIRVASRKEEIEALYKAAEVLRSGGKSFFENNNNNNNNVAPAKNPQSKLSTSNNGQKSTKTLLQTNQNPYSDRNQDALPAFLQASKSELQQENYSLFLQMNSVDDSSPEDRLVQNLQ